MKTRRCSTAMFVVHVPLQDCQRLFAFQTLAEFMKSLLLSSIYAVSLSLSLPFSAASGELNGSCTVAARSRQSPLGLLKMTLVGNGDL